MSQEFVAVALEPLQEKFPKAYIIHSMDDILISYQNEKILYEILAQLLQTLPDWGLVLPQKRCNKSLHFLTLATS
jgi:hypothetical protein